MFSQISTYCLCHKCHACTPKICYPSDFLLCLCRVLLVYGYVSDSSYFCTINAVFETYRFGRPISEITKVKGRRFMEKGESRAIVGDIEVTATTVMIGDKLEWVTEYAFTLCDGNSNDPMTLLSCRILWP